jgi:hypothetical protein
MRRSRLMLGGLTLLAAMTGAALSAAAQQPADTTGPTSPTAASAPTAPASTTAPAAPATATASSTAPASPTAPATAAAPPAVAANNSTVVTISPPLPTVHVTAAEVPPETLKAARDMGYKAKVVSGTVHFCKTDTSTGSRLATETCISEQQLDLLVGKRQQQQDQLQHMLGPGYNGH